MRRARIGRKAAFAVAAMLALSGGRPGRAAEDLESLNQQAVELHSKGRYKEAISIAEKALALAERTLGANDTKTLDAVNNLVMLYLWQTPR